MSMSLKEYGMLPDLAHTQMWVTFRRIFCGGVMEADGNAGIVLLTKLDTEWIEDRDFSKSRPEFSRNFDTNAIDTTKLPRNLSIFGKWVRGLGFGVRGSGVDKYDIPLKAHPRMTMHKGWQQTEHMKE